MIFTTSIKSQLARYIHDRQARKGC